MVQELNVVGPNTRPAPEGWKAELMWKL